MSCFQSLLSNPIEALMASRTSAAAPENRPLSILSETLLSAIRTARRLLRQTLRSAGSLVLYALPMAGAICGEAAAFDREALIEARQGTMRKLIFHSEPRPVSPPPMLTEDGAETGIDTFKDRVVVLNFWATWCAPCRREMPSLGRLQAEFDSADLTVIALATGRNEQPKVEMFLDSIEVDNLSVFYDPRLQVAASMGVRGLPATVILDRSGEEIARLTGDADWDDESAFHIFRRITAVE